MPCLNLYFQSCHLPNQNEVSEQSCYPLRYVSRGFLCQIWFCSQLLLRFCLYISLLSPFYPSFAIFPFLIIQSRAISCDFQLVSKLSKGIWNLQFISIVCNISRLYGILKT